MAVVTKVLIPAKTAEVAQTAQYTATGVSAASGSASNDNLIVKTKTLQASETYTFPELVGQVISPGGFISTIASTGTSINIRASGREIS